MAHAPPTASIYANRPQLSLDCSQHHLQLELLCTDLLLGCLPNLVICACRCVPRALQGCWVQRLLDAGLRQLLGQKCELPASTAHTLQALHSQLHLLLLSLWPAAMPTATHPLTAACTCPPSYRYALSMPVSSLADAALAAVPASHPHACMLWGAAVVVSGKVSTRAVPVPTAWLCSLLLPCRQWGRGH